jgi:hypothetical protein
MKTLAFASTALISFATASSVSANLDAVAVSVELLGSGAVGKCDHAVSRTLSVCERDGTCEVHRLSDDFSFVLPAGGSFTVSATVAYDNQGVVEGYSVSDRFTSVQRHRSFVQALDVSERCSYLFSYAITMR